MMQEIDMTDEEKIKMYMKLKKEDIAKMLIQANKHIKNMTSPQLCGTQCDICGNTPNVVIKTQFGTFCAEHVRYM